MSRTAQTLLPPRPGADLRSPAEQALLLVVWAGALALCLAFWATVALVLVR